LSLLGGANMTGKRYYYSISIFLLLCSFDAMAAQTITADALASKCQSAENAIYDISLEYEWYILPPLTFDDMEEPFKSAGALLPKDGISKHKLYAKRFIDQYGRNRWKYVFEESATIITKEGQSWDNLTRHSYDGNIYKKLNIGGHPQTVMSGLISSEESGSGVPLSTPIGYSIFRLENYTDNIPLSTLLKQHKETNAIRLADTTIKVNDFNAICVDLLSKPNNLPWIHIYFSVDHNCSPVKYEFLKNAKTGTISFSVEVHSLKQVGNGLWFPTSGLIRKPNEERVNAFRVTSEIVVNKGLTEKDFDINFPAGTKVEDRIAGREYTAKEDATK